MRMLKGFGCPSASSWLQGQICAVCSAQGGG
jgi:hypothetical protein